ncbi:MAG TPA: phospholipid scramblase-related protein [Polyangiaceae bacterium]|nr:phospholipid scramblase-related protein [Polyangiaceae bacterium]
MSNLLDIVQHSNELMIVQRRELAELIGFETRNKYAILANGAQIGFAAEQGKGGLAFLARMFLGHWRTFEIHFFDEARRLVLRALHPFRFFFQRLEVSSAEGRLLGSIQQRFSLFYKRFDVVDASERVLLTVSSPLWRPWTFAFDRQERTLARVEKKWSGLLREAFTDADRFRVTFDGNGLNPDERSLVLAAAVFIDLQFFERKAS